MMHHLTIMKNLGKDVQCLCFTVLQVRVGLMLVFLSLPLSFWSPLCKAVDKSNEVVRKLLRKTQIVMQAIVAFILIIVIIIKIL